MENRVERDIAAWRKQEQQIAALFPPSVVNSRDLKEQRLKELDKIYYTQRGGLSEAEKLSLRIVNIERRQLERQLYPNLLLLLLRRLFDMPRFTVASFQHTFVPRNLQYRQPDNVQRLNHALVSNGFKNVNADLAKQISENKPQFTITHSELTASHKRVDYELSFKKDDQGRYQFTGYDAALKTDGKPAETKRQHFTIDERSNNIKAGEAAHLLEGRSVQKMYFNAEGHLRNGWTKLDFNDRDASGNHKLKHTPESSGYDLSAVLRSFPLKDPSTGEKLSQQLKNGERVSVTLEKNGQSVDVFLDANPQTRSVNIYNSQHKKVALSEALGEKKDAAKVVALKNDLEQEPGQKQARRQRRSIY